MAIHQNNVKTRDQWAEGLMQCHSDLALAFTGTAKSTKIEHNLNEFRQMLIKVMVECALNSNHQNHKFIYPKIPEKKPPIFSPTLEKKPTIA